MGGEHRGSYIRCMGLFELADDLNVEHQISSVDVFHHIIQAILKERHREALFTNAYALPPACNRLSLKLKSQP